MHFNTTTFSLSVAIIMIVAIFIMPYEGQAATIEELRSFIEQKNQEIKRLEEEARRYRDEIISTQKASKTLKDELQRIERIIKQFKQDIVVIERKIEKKGLEIKTLALEVLEKEYSIRNLRNGLAGLVQSFSERDQQSLVEIMLVHNAFSDFFRQIDYSALAERKIIGALDSLRSLKKELEIKQADAEDKKEELEDLSISLRDQKKLQEGVKQDRNNLLLVTKNQETRYQALLRETEKKQESILRDIEGLEEALRKLVDSDSLPKAREGFLRWPADGRISQGYGETPFTKSSKGRHFYKFHNGVDIVALFGAPIYAADNGLVKAVGNTDQFCPRGAYGKYILIDHKNNLATMYAHLSLIKVAGGQEVKRGDIIGYMGNSGLSTGPHLHFTLYDARTVEIKLGTIGTCGLLPFGGSINPLVYF